MTQAAQRKRSVTLRYGFALAVTAAALLARLLLDPFLHEAYPAALMFIAVALSAWHVGAGPALLALGLGYLASDYLFLSPRNQLGLTGTSDLVHLVIYGAAGLTIVWMGQAMRASRRRAESHAREMALALEERKRAEQELRDREARFRTLAEVVPCCVWSAGPDGAITYANRRWNEFSGLTLAQTEGFGWAEVLHPEDRQLCLEEWQRAVLEGSYYRIEGRYRRYDGEYRWLLTEAVPMRGKDGAIVSWFGTNTDIHDQKETQSALRDADRRKNEFLGMLGHEIRNPLSVIANAQRVLSRSGSATPEISRMASMIGRQVGHLTRIVDDLLDVSRVIEGKIRLRKEVVEVATVVQSAVESAGPYLESRKQTLAVSLPKEAFWIEADVTRMTQVLGNLLSNAAKFSESEGRISLDVAREGENVEIRVRDQGAGIPEDLLSHVFDMFVQADQSLHRTRGGLGIGLTLARSLVALHRGSITARSEGPGKGSEFIVRLPIAVAPRVPTGAGRGAVADGRPRMPLRILVVDDNPDSVESLALILSIAGHRVRTAFNGAEAERIAREYRPDLVLLDIGLPETDGYEVARRLRGDPALKEIYLVAVTGYGQEEDRRRSEEAGFDRHLVKPFDPALLEELIASSRSPRTSDRNERRDASHPTRSSVPPLSP